MKRLKPIVNIPALLEATNTVAYSEEQAIALQNEDTIFLHFPGSDWNVIYSCCSLEVPTSGKWLHEQDRQS